METAQMPIQREVVEGTVVRNVTQPLQRQKTRLSFAVSFLKWSRWLRMVQGEVRSQNSIWMCRMAKQSPSKWYVLWVLGTLTGSWIGSGMAGAWIATPFICDASITGHDLPLCVQWGPSFAKGRNSKHSLFHSIMYIIHLMMNNSNNGSRWEKACNLEI